MINEHALKQLNEIMRDPGFEIITNRIKLLRADYLSKLVGGSKESFDLFKGKWEAADLILWLLSDPKNLANDGVSNLGNTTGT